MSIKPHKGGRTEVVVARLTKDEKQLVWKKKKNKSFSDWIVERAIKQK